MEIVESSVLSSDGIHYLRGRVYIPCGEVKGYLHIVHGMAEHIGRYDPFMKSMTEQGFICFGYDHIGHGMTAGESELGFIAPSDGWKYLCKDVEVFASHIRAQYGEMPYYLMGHSMGSFIVRIAVTMGSKPDRLIIMGTGGPNPAADIGIALCRIISALFGEKHVSGFINKMAFGSYNKRFPAEGEHAWLTNVESQRLNYENDPLSGYDFTVSAMADLMLLNRNANADSIFKNTSSTMPILLVSGEDDPVGDYGVGVKDVFGRYKGAGCTVEMRLYEGCRHEILNDICSEKTVLDIQNFLSQC